VLAQIENCVIESNNSYGMEIYAPANTIFFHNLDFKEVWFENNCQQSNDRYQLYIHSDTAPGVYLLTNIRFEQCAFSANTDTQSCINVQRAQFVTFDECGFYCDNPDRDIVLGTDLDEEERSALAGAAENEQREAASLARLLIREGLKARGFLK
jgi:hypothetical protein